MFQLTVRKNVSERKAPPAAATLVQRPNKVPSPTASSPRAINRLTKVGACAESDNIGPIGLLFRSLSIWCTAELGLFGSR